MTDIDIKFLISQAVDGETLTDAEHQIVASALKESADLRTYEAELLRLKQAMDLWPGMESSADWEQNMDKTMARLGIKEEKMINRIQLSRNHISTGILVIIIMATFLTTQTYIKRGLQGRFKSSADDIGDQYSVQNSSYPLASNDAVNKRFAPQIVDRKIIRTVSMNFKVDNCQRFQTQVTSLVRQYDGLIENSQIGTTNNNGSGTVTFKVPPKNLEAILVQIRTLGDLQSENGNANDVTGQFVDTQARLNNLKATSDRLSRLMSERTAHLNEVLEIERELTRVTGEIEAMESHLKLLDDSAALATVTVAFYTEAKPSPVKWFQSLHLNDRFRGTIETAVDVAVNIFNAMIVVIGFFIPVVFWGLVIWGIVMLVRKLRKKN